MANAGQQARKRDDLEHWRRVLPGVADQEIVLPRYNALGFNFPTPPQGHNCLETWQAIRYWMYFVAHTNCFPPTSGRDERMRRLVRNIFGRASRWWVSLGEPTTLMLNQRLYSHRNAWKDIYDIGEFHVCYSLCLAWLNLPAGERSANAAKVKVQMLLREMIKHVEAGEPPPEIEPVDYH